MTEKHLCETDPFCFTCPQCEDEAQTGIHTFPPAKEPVAETLAVLAEDLGASVDELLDYAGESVGAPQPWKDFVPEEHHFVRAPDYGGWQVKDGPSPMEALRKASRLPATYFDGSPITDESMMLYVAARMRGFNKGYDPEEDWSAKGCTKCRYLEGVFQEYCPWHLKIKGLEGQLEIESAHADVNQGRAERAEMLLEVQKEETRKQKEDWYYTTQNLANLERALEMTQKTLALAQARAEKAEKALELLQTKFTITGPALTRDEHLAKIKAEVDTWPEWKKTGFIAVKEPADCAANRIGVVCCLCNKNHSDGSCCSHNPTVYNPTVVSSPTKVVTVAATVVTTAEVIFPAMVEDNYVFCQCDQYQRDNGHSEHCPFGVPRI